MIWAYAPYWGLVLWVCWMVVISHVLLAVRVITSKRSER